MAYYSEPEKDQGDNSQGMNVQEGLDSSGNPIQLTNPGSASTSSGSTSKGAAPKSASSGTGPSFQNYAKANQGKAQTNLNEAVAKNVANAGQVATNTINQSTTQFGKRVDQGSLANRENAIQDVSNVTNAARNIQAGTGVDADQQKRFQEVINARYQGPESLRQAGLYQIAADKTGTAQTAIDRTQSALGREDLLKSMYEKRGAYNTGLNKLDSALLNASQQGVQNLQNVAKAQGNLGQKLDQAQIGSANLAKNRTEEIKGIQEGARTAFSEGKKGEEAATEARLASVIKDWDKLPEYYRNIIRNKAETNKSMATDAVNQYKSANKEIAKEYEQYQGQTNQLTSKMAELERASQSLQRNINDANLYAQPGKEKEYISKYASQIQANDAKVKEINNQLAGLQAANADKINVFNNYASQLASLENEAINPNLNRIQLNPFEAAVLGVNSGEGLYNLGERAIKTAAYDKNRLVSRDEQARQAALASLAGLDQSNRLDTNLLYNNADLAGTQSALDALDVAGIRRGLNEAETGFRTTSKGTNLTGTGSKKVSRGNAFGKKTKTYSASVGGNVGDFLSKGGYDLNAPLAQGTQYGVSGADLLNSYLDATNTQRVNPEDNTLQSAAMGAGTGASLGSAGGLVGAGIGAGAGAMAGATLGSGTADQYQQAIDVLGQYAPGIGQALQDARNLAGKGAENLTQTSGMTAIPDALLGGALSKSIGGLVGGIDSGAMKSYGTAVAKDLAVKDLQSKYRDYLAGQGFDNRINISNSAPVVNRMSALQQLLASLDKTNT